MRIRKPRGLTTTQLMVATVIGVLGGVYIYKPIFVEYSKKTELHNDSVEPVEVNSSVKQTNTTVSSEQKAATK